MIIERKTSHLPITAATILAAADSFNTFFVSAASATRSFHEYRTALEHAKKKPDKNRRAKVKAARKANHRKK